VRKHLSRQHAVLLLESILGLVHYGTRFIGHLPYSCFLYKIGASL
jgi:hypothetical protein